MSEIIKYIYERIKWLERQKMYKLEEHEQLGLTIRIYELQSLLKKVENEK